MSDEFIFHMIHTLVMHKLRAPHVGQEMITLSGTPDFTPFGEFMILLIGYIYIVYH